MSRSTYIYVLSWAERVESPMPIAARTVKWELVEFLKDMPDAALGDIEVWRLRDGIATDDKSRVHLGTAREFLAKELGR